MTILNLTQHMATPEQHSAGVVEPTDKNKVQVLLTFTGIPQRAEILDRCHSLVSLAKLEGATHAMIGGAPYLMGPLEKELRFARIVPLYAFSERVSVEEVVDGKTVKKSVFRHVGFVESAVI